MAALIIYIFVSVFTPGPNNIFSSISTSKRGFMKTLPFMYGVFVGTFIVFVITTFFNMILLENVTIINRYVGIVGGIYILFLALQSLLSYGDDMKEMITNDRLFTSAILLTLINPKAIIFGVTVAMLFIQRGYSDITMYSLALVNAFLCFVSVILWGLLGMFFKKLLTQYNVIYRIVMAVLLGYSGIAIIIETI